MANMDAKEVTKEAAKAIAKKVLTSSVVGSIASVLGIVLLIVLGVFGLLIGLGALFSGKGSAAEIENPGIYLNNNLIVKTDMMPEIVLSKSKLEDTIKTHYSGTMETNLLGVIDELAKIQTENKVNAVFAIAVFQTESGCGTGWDLISSSTHNWQSVQKWGGTLAPDVYVDRNGTTWCSFESFNQATLDFGKYISEHSVYFKAGKYTIYDIGTSYCPPGPTWSETVFGYMKSFLADAGIDVDEIITEYNSRAMVGGTGWWLPVSSSLDGLSSNGITINDPFGAYESWRTSPHGGTDLGGGAKVIASRSGTVTTAGWHDSYGNYIIIDHGDGFESLYAHLSSMDVSVGDTVSQGQKIGIPGETGNATGVHLHFEIRKDGVRVDPEDYISIGANSYPTGGTSSGTFDSTDYVIVNNAGQFASYARSNHNYQGYSSIYSDACFGVSAVYCDAIKTGRFSISDNYNGARNDPRGLTYYGWRNEFSSTKEGVLKKLYQEISRGNPAILHVNGNTSGSSRHYVAAVGYKKSATLNTIKETDLLILDSWDALIETMTGRGTICNTGAYSRFMTSGYDTGRTEYNYQAWLSD